MRFRPVEVDHEIRKDSREQSWQLGKVLYSWLDLNHSGSEMKMICVYVSGTEGQCGQEQLKQI